MTKTNKSPSLTTNDVKHVAKLANLPLTEKEIPVFKKQLSEILGYIDQLQEVETSNVEPTSQVTGLTNVFLSDEPKTSLSQKEAISNAKQTKNGYFQVPAILENQ